MQRELLHTDIAQDSSFFEDLVADQCPSRDPDDRKFMLYFAILLEAANLFYKRRNVSK